MIRPSIGNASGMMRLQIRLFIGAEKRRGVTTSLARTMRPSEDVIPDGLASVVVVSLGIFRRGRASWFGGLICSGTEVVHRLGGASTDWRLRIQSRRCIRIRDRDELKNDGFPIMAIDIGRSPHLISGTSEDALEPNSHSLPERPEHEEVSAISRVISDRKVSSHKFHVPALPFARIEEDPVFVPAVPVPILFARLSRKQEDEWLAFGGGDASLTLTAKHVVDVSPTIVTSANLK
jgi:hypothetical protein